MFAAFAGKLAVTIVLGFSAGFFGSATEAMNDSLPLSVGSGAFGGPVTHVGAIEWDVAQPASPALSRVRCASGAGAGMRCFISR